MRLPYRLGEGKHNSRRRLRDKFNRDHDIDDLPKIKHFKKGKQREYPDTDENDS